jgi:hypothetical protein
LARRKDCVNLRIVREESDAALWSAVIGNIEFNNLSSFGRRQSDLQFVIPCGKLASNASLFHAVNLEVTTIEFNVG